jgi:hypothetical protein
MRSTSLWVLGVSLAAACGAAPTAEAPTVQQFARGGVYFAAKQWVAAATVFRSLALDHPDKAVGTLAARSYLDSLNVLFSLRAIRSQA